MAVKVDIRKKVAGIHAEKLATFAAKAQRAIGLRGGVGVVVTSDAEMKQMNSWFRGKNRPTDVLSFVAAGVRGYAGDISISADLARVNARRFGHSVKNEIEVLVLHGMLHLAGYDHENDDGKMAEKEQHLRAKLGLAATLIERATPKTRVQAVRAK